jgi:hypothetical protein
MRPLPLLAAAALLAILALRRRTLERLTAAAGLLVVVVLVGYGLGLYTLPSIDDALTRLAPALGNWTYALVGVLAYLEAAAFVGLLVPGELTVVLGGAVARDGEVSIGLLFVIVWFAACRRHDRIQPQARSGFPSAWAALPHHAGDRRASRASSTGMAARRSSSAASSVARAVTPFLAGSSHLHRRFLASTSSAPVPKQRRPGRRLSDRGERFPRRRLARDRPGIGTAAAVGALVLVVRQVIRAAPAGAAALALRWARRLDSWKRCGAPLRITTTPAGRVPARWRQAPAAMNAPVAVTASGDRQERGRTVRCARRPRISSGPDDP